MFVHAGVCVVIGVLCGYDLRESTDGMCAECGWSRQRNGEANSITKDV